MVPVPDEQLPVKLPDDVTFDRPGNPLDHHPTWKHVACPECGAAARRETDTFDTFVDSAWYFARYCSPHANVPVDARGGRSLDAGGSVHRRHRARDPASALFALLHPRDEADRAHLAVDEPFAGLFTQGMVTHESYRSAPGPNGTWLYPEEIVKQADGAVGAQRHRRAGRGRSRRGDEQVEAQHGRSRSDHHPLRCRHRALVHPVGQSTRSRHGMDRGRGGGRLSASPSGCSGWSRSRGRWHRAG